MNEACGQYRGYQAHRRRGEEPCADCRRANNAYMAQWRRSQAELQARNASVQHARNRALRRLALLFPAQFQTLYDQELAESHTERWAS